MRYEVPVGAVGGTRGRRDVPAVLVGACLVVVAAALAAVAGPAEPGTDRSPRNSGAARAMPAAPTPTGSSATSAPSPRPLPGDLECRGLVPATCRRVVAAALSVVPPDAPQVVAASAWDSIVCGDTFDCPTRRLDRAYPLGSVIVSFADGSPDAIVNVVEARFGANIRLGVRAWLLDRAAIPAARPAAGPAEAGAG